MADAADKSESAPLLSQVPPSAVYHAAAALCEQLKTIVSANPREAEKMLLGAWTCVEDELYKLIQHPATPVPEASVVSALLFLREYFRHAGNWDAMHACLKKGERVAGVTVVTIKIGGASGGG